MGMGDKYFYKNIIFTRLLRVPAVGCAVRAVPGLSAVHQQAVLLQQRQGEGVRTRVEHGGRQPGSLRSRGHHGHRSEIKVLSTVLQI